MISTERRAAAFEQQERALRDMMTIDAYRAGDQGAFNALVQSYEGTVTRLLAQMNVPGGDVEDLTQEVFLRVFRNLERFRGGSSFYTWLYRITVNVFFDHNKKRKRSDSRLMRLQNAIADKSNQRVSVDDPFVETYNTMMRNQFIDAIAALPEPFRAVVAMREVDDLSYEEIALMTGISIGTVRSRLSRARSRLKELLRPIAAAAA